VAQILHDAFHPRPPLCRRDRSSVNRRDVPPRLVEIPELVRRLNPGAVAGPTGGFEIRGARLEMKPQFVVDRAADVDLRVTR
jgi:hypothetical protein